MRRIILFLLPAILIASCSPKGDKTDSKRVFRYNEANGITSLDPAFARSMTNIWAVNQIFNGLVQLGPSLEVEPCLAYRWEMPDDKTYRFYLRRDVRFQKDPCFGKDSTRGISARDMEYSLRRITDPATASPGSWIFSVVTGADDGSYRGFVTENDSVFTIHLENPFPPFLGLLTNMYCSMVPHEAIEKYGKDFRSHPVGTGPFKFAFWKEGEILVLHKNPDYFETDNGQRLPFLDAVSISFLNDKQQEFMEFVQGKFDMLNTIDVAYKDELLDKEGRLRSKYLEKFVMESKPFLNTEYLGFLVDKKVNGKDPLRDPRVRKAISIGFDRSQMIRYLRNSMGTPATGGFVPLGMPGFFRQMDITSYDPAKASALLKEAGYPEGKGLPEIVLSTTGPYSDLGEFIQNQLADIGVKVRLEINQGATHREMVARQKLDFFRGSWLADYPDAENYLSLFYSKNFAPGGPNTTHYSSALFDKWYEESRQTLDTTIRYRLYRSMDSLVMNETPVVVLFYDKIFRLYQKNLHGVQANSMNLLTLKHARKN